MGRIILVFLASAYALCADGGNVLLRQQAGAFVITLFSQHTPIRVGKADLSALVESSNEKKPVLNATVLIHLRRPGGAEIMEFVLPAKRDPTSNLYAVAANLPATGKWPIRVFARNGKDEATVTGMMDVQPSQPAIVTYWPFFVAVPLLALVFAINLRLRRGREFRHPRAKP